MKRIIPCLCESSFEAEIPEEINLDSDPAYIEEILSGRFLNFNCPNCNKKHKPEFFISVLWPSKNLSFEVFPELDRGEFYRREKPSAKKHSYNFETIIGYPEMAERITVIRDGLDPIPIEAIKYHLQLKAEDQFPENEMEIWYFTLKNEDPNGFIEFHIHGIRENEVAVMKVPMSLYQKTCDDYKQNPKSEIFRIIRFQSYLSYKNTMRHETSS